MRRNINSCKWFCIEIKTSVQQKFSTNSTNSVHPSSLKSRDKTKYRFEAQPRRIQRHLHSSRTFGTRRTTQPNSFHIYDSWCTIGLLKKPIHSDLKVGNLTTVVGSRPARRLRRIIITI